MKIVGKGTFRTVYIFDKDTVLKKNNSDYNKNLKEWNHWLRHKNTNVGKFLCPCIEYREDKTLLMKRCGKTYHHKSKKEMRKLLREQHTPHEIVNAPDPTGDNFGDYNGRIVCTDYDKLAEK